MGVASFVLGDSTGPLAHCDDLSGFADVTKVLDWVQGIIKGCNGSTGPDGNNGSGSTTGRSTTLGDYGDYSWLDY